MPFVINAAGMTAGDAKEEFDAAVRYLRQSDMARSILDELGALPERITILIGNDIEPKYRHPKVDDGQDGGIVEWNPGLSVDVFDSPRARPTADWVENATERHGFLWLQTRQIVANGKLSAPIALIHELGHAYQFFGDRAGYRAAVKRTSNPHEDNLVGGIETVIITELRARGNAEGIRWDYMHSGTR